MACEVGPTEAVDILTVCFSPEQTNNPSLPHAQITGLNLFRQCIGVVRALTPYSPTSRYRQQTTLLCEEQSGYNDPFSGVRS